MIVVFSSAEIASVMAYTPFYTVFGISTNIYVDQRWAKLSYIVPGKVIASEKSMKGCYEYSDS